MGADDRQEGGSVAGVAVDFGGLDRLGAAQRLLWVSLGLTAVGLLGLVCDARWRPRHQLERSAQVMARLDLGVPAWVPAGRAGRHVAAWRSAIDLRPTPAMFRFDPSLDRWLLSPSRAPAPGPFRDEVDR